MNVTLVVIHVLMLSARYLWKLVPRREKEVLFFNLGIFSTNQGNIHQCYRGGLERHVTGRIQFNGLIHLCIKPLYIHNAALRTQGQVTMQLDNIVIGFKLKYRIRTISDVMISNCQNVLTPLYHMINTKT